METSGIPPQDSHRDDATAGNRTGRRQLRRPEQDRAVAAEFADSVTSRVRQA